MANHRSLRYDFNKHSDKGAKLQLRTLKGCSCFFGRKLLKKVCANARSVYRKRKVLSMKRKATFAVKNAKPNSSAHNSRKSMPKYLIETDPNFSENSYEKFGNYQDDKQYREYAKKLYTQKFLERKNQAQTMQKSQVKSLIKEVVITTEKHHTKKDIIELFDKLREKKGGYHILEVAEHRDEGHFERVGKHGEWENLTYYPTKDILLKEDGNWYIKSDETKEAKSADDFDLKADMSEFKKVHNYHFHVKFTHFDERTGLTARLSKMDVSGEGRLKLVAKHLGLRYAPEEKIPLEQGVKSVKEQHHINRQSQYKQILENQKNRIKMAKVENENKELKSKLQELQEKLDKKGKVSQKDLSDLKEQHRKEMIADSEIMDKEAYTELNELFKKAVQDNKAKELDLQKLERQIYELKERSRSQEKKIEETKEQVQQERQGKLQMGTALVKQSDKVKDLKEQLEDAQAEIEALEKKNYKLENEVDQLKRQQEELKKALETRKELDLEFQRIEQERANIDKVIKSYEENIKKIEDYNEKVQEAQKTVLSKNIDIDALEEKHTKKSITGKKLDVEGFKEDIKKEIKEIKDLHADNYKTTNNIIRVAKANYQKILNQFKDLHGRFASAYQSVKERIKQSAKTNTKEGKENEKNTSAIQEKEKSGSRVEQERQQQQTKEQERSTTRRRRERR